MIYELSGKESSELAYDIQELFYLARIDERFKDNSEFFQGLSSIMDESFKQVRDIQLTSGEISYCLDTSHDVASAFAKKFEDILDRVYTFAYSISEQYGNVTDVILVVVPFVLLQFNIPNENIIFYLSLAMTISRIIVNRLASKKESKIKQETERDIEQALKASLVLLVNANKSNEENGEEIESCKIAIKNVLKEKKKRRKQKRKLD